MITMTTKINVTLEQYIASAMNDKLPPVVKKHAFQIAAKAATNAPVDTGLLKNTLAEGAKPVDPRNWTISDGTDYGVFQELGTSRGVKAKHMLGNACEKEADKFFDDVRDALK